MGFGVWRSLVAHLHGVQGVEGSNPFTPTKNKKQINGSGPKVLARFFVGFDTFEDS